MKNKKIKIFTLLISLLMLAMSFSSIVLAYDPVDNTGGTGGQGGGNAQDVDGACLNWPNSGIEYTIILENSAGSEIGSYTKFMYCGEDNYYGKIKGYGVTGKDDLDKPCPLPKGQIEIPLEDVIGFLKKQNQNDLATKIENNEPTTVTLIARSVYAIGGRGRGTEYEYWTDAITGWNTNDEGREGSFTWNLTLLRKMKGGIFEENQDLWSFLGDEIGTTFRVKLYNKDHCVNSSCKGSTACMNGTCTCCTPEYSCRYCFNKYMGWFAIKYEVGPGSETMELAEDVEPVVYANIDNQQFSVYSASDVNGNPIPTSEKVNILGESNMYGSVTGLQKFGTQTTADVNGTITANYYIYDSEAKTLTLDSVSQTYNGSTTGYVTWLDASNATVTKKAEFNFLNDALKNGKVTHTTSNVKVDVNKNSKRGQFTQKTGTVNYTYAVPASEVTALTRLLELANAGSAWADAELSTRTGTMKAEAEQKILELTPFFNVETDTVTFNGENIERNGALVGSFYKIEKKDNVVQNVANKSVNDAYITTGTAKAGDFTDTICSVNHNKVNNIRVHTPINANVLVNGAPAASAVIKPQETINISMPFDSSSTYYQSITDFDITKYINKDKVEIRFKKIGTDGSEKTLTKVTVKKKDVVANKTLTSYKVPELADGEQLKVEAKVVAINASATGANTTETSATINQPDSVYVLVSSESKPVVVPERNIEYVLAKVEDASCGKTPESTAKIKNNTFKPEDGYLIPTSESLFVDGTTTLLGQISGIEIWNMEFTENYVEDVYIEGYYVSSRTVFAQNQKLSGDTWINDGAPTAITYYTLAEYQAANIPSAPVVSADGKTRTVYSTTENISTTGEWKTLTSANCPGFSYTVTTNATVDNHVVAEIENTPLGGTRTKTLTTPALSVVDKGDLLGDDTARVVEKNLNGDYKSITINSYGAAYDTMDALMAALDVYEIDQRDFWGIASDELIVSATSGAVTENASYTRNCPVLQEDFTNIPATKIDGITKTAIEMIANGTYNSLGKLTCAGKEYEIPNINSVKVYTPVSNTISLTVTGEHTDEYAGRVDAAPGQKIAQLGDTLNVTVDLGGSVRGGYATTANPVKYAEKLEFNCGVCGTTEVVDDPSRYYYHTCVIAIELEEEDYIISSIVTAENIQPGADTANGSYNSLNNEYNVKNSINLSIVGDIYDFNVRTTNDTGWKIKPTQYLDKLPIGEKGDNTNSIYRYGIKLGYRAYFDLKTLGSKSNKIKLTPKFYYVSKDGSTVIENPDLYYRTITGYKKLSDADIALNMTMASTNGEVNNDSFKREQALALQSTCFSGIDYDMRTGIGGLNEVVLSQMNAVITKYKGQEYPGDKGNVSRRWLGEFYLPASTVVAQDGATLTQVANKQKVYLDGYLLVTFEDVYSVESDGTRYLNYDSMKIDREQDGKTSLTLPDALGATRTMTIPDDELPVVIYDISLRANNDYESEGTH